MGFLSNLVGGNKDENAVNELFEKISRILEDEQFQLELAPAALKEILVKCPAYDRDPNGMGPFGLSEANPIPVNGPVGELAYLSNLETAQGQRLLFHRIGSVGTIDVFEAVTFSGSEWFIFFVDFYHPRRSRVTPDGFRFSKQANQFSGFHRFCKNFPYDFAEMKQSGEGSVVSLAYMAIGKVSQQIQNGAFKRPLAHKAKLDIVKGRLTSSKTQ
jgi:hypothetical protein